MRAVPFTGPYRNQKISCKPNAAAKKYTLACRVSMRRIVQGYETLADAKPGSVVMLLCWKKPCLVGSDFGAGSRGQEAQG